MTNISAHFPCIGSRSRPLEAQPAGCQSHLVAAKPHPRDGWNPRRRGPSARAGRPSGGPKRHEVESRVGKAVTSPRPGAPGAADHHQSLVAKQTRGAERALPLAPPLSRLQRERAQPRVAVRDPEDPRQPRRLPRTDVLGLQHEHATPRGAPTRTPPRARRSRRPTTSDVHRHATLSGFGSRVADLQDIVDDLEAEIRAADLGRGPPLAAARPQRAARRDRSRSAARRS